MQRPDRDEIILRFLRERERDPDELRRLCKAEGIPYQTYYRRLNKLKERGVVQEINEIRIVRQIQTADRHDVIGCLKIIGEESSEHVILSRIDRLKQISAGKRVANIPSFAVLVDKCFRNPLIKENSKVFVEFVEMLSTVLRFEKASKLPDSSRIVEALLCSCLKTIMEVGKDSPEFPHNYVVDFTGLSGKEEAVHFLFSEIASHKEYVREVGLSANSLREALGRRGLYEAHRELIERKIDDLCRSEDKELVEIGRELGQQIRWRS